jgi:hypothetical protein
MTAQEAYALADWAVRTVLPAILEYDDGIRMTFNGHAAKIRQLRPIRHTVDATEAIKLLKHDITPAICQFRDGMITVPLRIAHWLCMVAIAIERGYAMPMDYGSQGIYSACDYMKIPIRKLVPAA